MTTANLLNKDYLKYVKAAARDSGNFSRNIAAATVIAFKQAVCSKVLFELQDLEARRATMPATIKAAFGKAIQAGYALAFGEETSDKRGNAIFTVKAEDCKADRLLEADRDLWNSRSDCLKHLDSFKVKVTRAAKAKAAPTLADLLSVAVDAYKAYKEAGGDLATFISAADPETVKAAAKAKAKADKADKADKAA